MSVDDRVGVLIVDDEPDIRLVLRLTMRSSPVLEVVGEAGSGPEAMDMCARLRPRIVLLDQMMPGMTGIETATHLLERWPEQAIVLCSAYLDRQLRERAEGVGIRATVSKEDVRVIPDVLEGLARAS